MNENTAIQPAAPAQSALALMPREHYSLIKDLAKAFSASGFFSDAKQEGQAFVKMLAGVEMGLAPFEAMSSFHVIEGRVEMSAQLMAAKVKASPKYDYRVLESTSRVCRIEFYELDATGAREVLGISEWTLERADKTGVSQGRTGRKTNWATYPDAMLFARAMSSGVRRYCPDALGAHAAPAYVFGEIGERDVPPDGGGFVASATVRPTQVTDASRKVGEMLRKPPPEPEPEAATEQPPPEDVAERASSGDFSPGKPKAPSLKADLLREIREMEPELAGDSIERACASISATSLDGIDTLSAGALKRLWVAMDQEIYG